MRLKQDWRPLIQQIHHSFGHCCDCIKLWSGNSKLGINISSETTLDTATNNPGLILHNLQQLKKPNPQVVFKMPQGKLVPILIQSMQVQEIE